MTTSVSFKDLSGVEVQQEETAPPEFLVVYYTNGPLMTVRMVARSKEEIAFEKKHHRELDRTMMKDRSQLPFKDLQTASRISSAMAHATQLCGGAKF